MELEVGQRVWIENGPYEVEVEVAKITEAGAVLTYPHTLTQGVNVRWQGLTKSRTAVHEFGQVQKPTNDMGWLGRALWVNGWVKPE